MMTQNQKQALSPDAAKERAAFTSRPSYDQMYLVERINTASEGRAPLTVAAVQRLNLDYGISVVSDALRSMRVLVGDGAEIRSPYPYLDKICRASC